MRLPRSLPVPAALRFLVRKAAADEYEETHVVLRLSDRTVLLSRELLSDYTFAHLVTTMHELEDAGLVYEVRGGGRRSFIAANNEGTARRAHVLATGCAFSDTEAQAV